MWKCGDFLSSITTHWLTSCGNFLLLLDSYANVFFPDDQDFETIDFPNKIVFFDFYKFSVDIATNFFKET